VKTLSVVLDRLFLRCVAHIRSPAISSNISSYGVTRKAIFTSAWTIVRPAVIAVAKPSDGSLRLSASPDGVTSMPLRWAVHDRQLLDHLGGVSDHQPCVRIGWSSRLSTTYHSRSAARSWRCWSPASS
jgi:hypothetical protein